ncbi:MAG: NfeD family protein [Gammaproteobacteria bacterium]|nr:NfeD family protein [Gammaproteobacteria bacterium]
MLSNPQASGFTSMLPVIIAVVVSAAVLILIVLLLLRARRLPIVSGSEELINSQGDVILIPGDEAHPRVRIRGELWQIRSNVPLEEGQTVKVVAIDELFLIVSPVNSKIQKGKSA